MMMKRFAYLFLLLAAVLAGLAYWVLPKVQLQSDIMALFPQDAQDPSVNRANNLLASSVDDKLFFLLSSSDWQATKEVIPAFVETLRSCNCIESVTAEQDLSELQKVRQHYLQYAPVLLSEKDRVLLQEGQGEALVTSALRELPADPAGLSDMNLIQDPLGTADDFFSTLQQQLPGRGTLESGYNYFEEESSERRHVLVVADLAGSPHSLAVQNAAGKVIDAARAGFTMAVPDPEIVQTGTFFSARAGSEQARREVSLVAAGSVLAIVVMLLLVFRSPTVLLLSALPVAAGILMGLTVTGLMFGSVHIAALVLGASLIGVSIDYSLHFLCKRQALANEWRPELGLQTLLPSLTLGLLTSVAGYLSFTVAGFPAFHQVAVFSCTGLVTAYVVVIGVYPWLLREPAKKPAPAFVRRILPRYLAGIRNQLRRLKYPEVALPLLALAAIGLWQLEPQDDLRAMQTPDPTLEAQERRFRQLAGNLTATQYLLVQGSSEESLLQRLEQLQKPLQQAVSDGHIQRYINLSSWLPSQATQEQNNQLLRQHVVERGQFEAYLNAVGINPERQEELLQRYQEPAEDLLTMDNTLPLLEDLLDLPLYFTEDGSHYSLILFEGLRKTGAIEAIAESSENVLWVDRIANTNQQLRHYRLSATLVLGVAYLAVLALLVPRYRLRGSLSVLAPPFFASVFAVNVLAALGVGFSVFNVMALLLILGIGVDYTVFMRESRGRGYDTVFAIGLSTATTVVSFGLLSLSATQAIFSFGLTVLLGIAVSFLLAPMAIQPREVGRSNDRRRGGREGAG